MYMIGDEPRPPISTRYGTSIMTEPSSPSSTSLPLLRLAVFDCDGTLVDSQHAIIAAMGAACEAHGYPRPTAAAVRRVVGLSLMDAVAGVVPEASKEELPRLRDSYADAFRELRDRDAVSEPLYPGALEALATLEARGWLLGVATGKSRVGLLRTLERHDLEKRFVTLQTSDRGPGKPAPDLLLRAMAETGVRAADTVMIGDTTYDMLMARNAGTRAVGVSWGYHPVNELHKSGAHQVVDHFHEVPTALETGPGERP